MGAVRGASRPPPGTAAVARPAVYNLTALETELERVFDICHGCRAASVCANAFPTLFDGRGCRS